MSFKEQEIGELSGKTAPSLSKSGSVFREVPTTVKGMLEWRWEAGPTGHRRNGRVLVWPAIDYATYIQTRSIGVLKQLLE